MKRIKVSEATGPALDWMVWKCAGGADAYPKTASGAAFLKLWKGNSAEYVHPSTDWSQGGPIIEREKIELVFGDSDAETWIASYSWHEEYGDRDDTAEGRGPTPLIAAMRCYVASKLGDKVEVPEELV